MVPASVSDDAGQSLLDLAIVAVVAVSLTLGGYLKTIVVRGSCVWEMLELGWFQSVIFGITI